MPSVFLLVIIYLAFISLGLPDSVFGVAWPDMRADFSQPLEAGGLVAIILMAGSAISSFSSAFIIKRLGPGIVVTISCILTSVGLLGYSLSPSYVWVLLSAIPLGFGAGAVDSSLNGYVAKHYESRHMNWLHASWGVGATIGPIIMAQIISAQLGWQTGYMVIAGIQASLVVIFIATLGLWKQPGERKPAKTATTNLNDTARTVQPATVNGSGTVETPASQPEESPLNSYGKTKIHGMKKLEPWLQILLYALYAAAEFCIGLWTVSLLIESRAIAKETAGIWVGLYYAGITVGRILSGFVVHKLGNRNTVNLGLAVSFVGVALFFLPAVLAVPAWFALLGLILIGLGFAPIYPCLMHETPERFDHHTYQTVIGFQIAAACLGASFIPTLVAAIASTTTLEILAPVVAGFLVLIFAITLRLDKTT